MNHKLRILFALESYPPEITGSGIATIRLVRSLAKRGHKIAVVCPGKKLIGEQTREGRIIVYRISSLPVIFHKEFRFSPFAFINTGKFFKKFNPDIIHIEDHLFTARAAVRFARKNNIKIIGTNHFTPYNWLYNLNLPDGTFIYKIVKKILWNYFLNLFNKIDVITVPSLYARKILKNSGIKKPVKVISNGLELKEFKKTTPEDETLSKYKIDSKKIILLSASRLDKEKRVDLLINAICKIKDRAYFHLIITGRGKEKEKLKKITMDKGLSGLVTFTDFITKIDLRNLYHASDIFLTASEVELQGLSIMEAMACGLPVIGAKSMAIPELVKDGINGYLFEPGNEKDAAKKILKLISNKKLREKMSENSLNLINKHDIELTLEEYEKIYYRLLPTKN